MIQVEIRITQTGPKAVHVEASNDVGTTPTALEREWLALISEGIQKALIARSQQSGKGQLMAKEPKWEEPRVE